MASLIVLACGSRSWADRALVEFHLDHLYRRGQPMTVIEGRCRGADRIAGVWAARMRARGVGWVAFPADWRRYGRGAGPVRNERMLTWLLWGRDLGMTVGVLAFHDDLATSGGTANMVSQARGAGVPVKVVGHEVPPPALGG